MRISDWSSDVCSSDLQAISRTLKREQLLQDLRAQAGVARAAMMHQAARHRIAWSFQVAQGRTNEAVLLAAAAGDIIAMARRFGPLGQASGFGRRVRDRKSTRLNSSH